MNIREFATRNKILILLFLLSTVFFLWQHSIHLSWDFTTYVSNARYWTEGSYYEISRPPLAPFVFLILGAFGAAAEQVFIVLVSILFLYSTIRLADRLKISREIFYIFSLSPMVLFFGMINGTELLSLALVELFLAFLIDKKPAAGIFLGLAFLTRYNFLIFLPLVFSNRSPKKILATFGLFALTLVPWLAFNFFTTGNMLTSLADSYALNFKFRYYFDKPFSFAHLFIAISFLLPLFVFGVLSAIRKWNVKGGSMKFLCREKANILLIIIFLLSIYQYASTPSKELRYLFPVALPVAYFSVKGLEWINRRKIALAIIGLIIIANLVLLASLHIPNPYEPREKYQNAISALEENFAECRLLTNAWPIINYLNRSAEPFPRRELLNRSIEEGNLILLFNSIGEPEWKSSLPKEFLIKETDDYILLGKGCISSRRYEHNYLNLTAEKILLARNVSINTNPCFVLFENSAAEGICNFANGRGFVKDKNRISGLEFVRD